MGNRSFSSCLKLGPLSALSKQKQLLLFNNIPYTQTDNYPYERREHRCIVLKERLQSPYWQPVCLLAHPVSPNQSEQAI